MLYNKNNVRKTNDKKILHKVGKQWKVVSVALLMAIGGGAAVAATNNTSANADVNVNDATQVNNEAAELENDTFNKPASASASSSAASKSTAAPSLASYSYAPSARVSGHNADAAYYNNHYEFDQQEVSYYGPSVKSYVNSVNARFPEAKNLQNSYNSASTSAIDASSAAKSYTNAAATPANGSIIDAMAAKAGLTSSDFISSVKAATLNYSSQVSAGSAENSAMGFINSLVNEVLNGNPSQSANNAVYAARTASANLQSASTVSSADQRNIAAVNSANAQNESALNDAINASNNAAENANVARILSGDDISYTNSAARVASNISAGSSVNSSAMSNAVSSAASLMNSSVASTISANKLNSYDASVYTSNVFSYASNGSAFYNPSFNILNTINGVTGTSYSVSYVSDADGKTYTDDGMAEDIADTAAQSAQTSVSASAARVIASAKAYKSAHANDVSSATAQARNDQSNVSSAYNAYEMAKANNLISSTIASGVGTNGSNAVGYINGLLNDNDLAAYFGGIAENDTEEWQDFAGSDAEANVFNSMYVSASASNSASSATYLTLNNKMMSGIDSDNADYSASSELSYYNDHKTSTVSAMFTDVNNYFKAKKNSSAANLFNSLFKSAGLNATDGSALNTTANNTSSAFSAMSSNASAAYKASDASLYGNNGLQSQLNSAYLNAASANNEFTILSNASDAANGSSAIAFTLLTDPDNQEEANNALNTYASSAFQSAALASGSAEGVDFSILNKDNAAFSAYGHAVSVAENSLDTNTGASHVAMGTSANLSDAMSLAQSSANSSYDNVVSASAKYSGDEDVNVTLASYFASSYTSDASSEANLANSASSALNTLYLDKADSATAKAYTNYYSALNAENGNKTLAHANGIFVLHNSPQFITLTKNAELHDAVLFNKKTALRSAKAGEQFAVKGVAFDKVGTLRYVVGTTKDGGYVYVTANDNYVENSYLEPDANYTVKLLQGANVHATKDFSSKVIKHLPAGTEFTGQAVPTLNVDHTYNYYYGVSRLAAFGGYVTANVNVVQNMPQNNNNNNNSSAASNNQKPAGNPANLVLFK